MKTYRIDVVPNEVEPYHLYERDESCTCLSFLFFTPLFKYHTKYNLADEALEYAVRDDNQNFQGFFYKEKRIDIYEAKRLTNEEKRIEAYKNGVPRDAPPIYTP